MNEPLAYLNGKLVPGATAAIAVWDAGFVLGATVTEQLRTFGGRIFRLEEHLARLRRSLAVVGVEPPGGIDRLRQVAAELVEKNFALLPAGQDLGLAMLVTPGAYATLAAGSVEPGPSVCLHTYPLPFAQWGAAYEKGLSLVVTEVEQVSPRCWPPELKCRSRMHYYLADRQASAREPGAKALLLDAEGRVTETSTANVLLYEGRTNRLVSPPAERVLPGVSMAVAVELAVGLGISLEQRDLYPADVAAADEVFVTSTPHCLLPVTRFNGESVAGGRPGRVYRELLDAWSGLVGVDIAGQAQRAAGEASSKGAS